MFRLFRKKEYSVTFNPSLLAELNQILTEIHEIFRDEDYSAQADCILRILAAVKSEDVLSFNKNVLSGSLIGAAGSVVDVLLQDKEKLKRLNLLLARFLKLSYNAGLKHRTLKARIKTIR